MLFGAGVAAFQLAGMGLRSWQLEEAATAGASTLAHGLIVGDPAGQPCWEASDGLQRPADYGEAETCRAIVAHLGGLDPERVTVRVTQALPSVQGQPSPYTVAVTYRDPVTSPLLRLLLGSHVTSTREATAAGE